MPPKKVKESGNSSAADTKTTGQERGATRSGARYAARNIPFYSSVRELLAHHQQLLQPGPVVATRYAAVGSARGTLLQTTIRFRSDHADIRGGLQQVFSDLFRLSSQRAGEGFEVVVTFNAVTSDSTGTNFSVFYGQDYGSRSGGNLGTRNELRVGDAVTVQTPDDVALLPTQFDLESLAARTRLQFDNSDLRVVRFLNIVYLVYQFSDGRGRGSSRRGGRSY